MQLHVIDCGNMMVDGGAMFGVVPKTMWSKKYKSNEQNLCNIKMRSLLIIDGDKKILIDTGNGNKQDPSFFKHSYLNGNGELIKSIAQAGYKPEDITDVVHTHLHFDHCGGTMKKNEAGNIVPTFPNATLWVSKAHWEWATKSNKREAPSFLPENILPMKDTGKLKFIHQETEFLPNIKAFFANGHTVGQVIPIINYKGKQIIFCADLIPTVANIKISFISAFDLSQLSVIDEKEKILKQAIEQNSILFFQHDISNECCTVKQTEKGILEDKCFNLTDIDANI